MSLIEMDFDEFPETGPEIHSLVPEEWRDHDQSSEHSLPVKDRTKTADKWPKEPAFAG